MREEKPNYIDGEISCWSRAVSFCSSSSLADGPAMKTTDRRVGYMVAWLDEDVAALNRGKRIRYPPNRCSIRESKDRQRYRTDLDNLKQS